jgi:YVTN family beta-propeller protein
MQTMRQRFEITFFTLEWPRVWLLLLFVLLLSGCFSDDDSERLVPITAPIDVSGVWGGNWSGYDPELGRYVSGNWEADLNQSGTTVGGSGVLDGDVDCMDGLMSGSLSKGYVISGDIVREPCGTNEWVITSLSLLNREASGVWTKPSVGGEGDFTGIQVATPDGPRIRHFVPPGGLPGTIVSITGERFADSAADNTLDFNGVPATTLQIRDTQRIITEVPAGATIGPLALTDKSGATPELGRSVLSFNTAVTYPTPESIDFTIQLGGYGSKGIAITPNGRRAFVIFPYSVNMIDVSGAVELGYGTNTNYATQAVVASPDSRFIYISTEFDVLIVHAGLNEIEDRISIPGGNTSLHNPHGLAITPDGKSLLVADNRPGGGVSVIDIENKKIVSTLSVGTSATPFGIAISPDGLFAYITLHDTNQVKEYSLETYLETRTFDVGGDPTGLAILPDGSRLYVSNTTENTVSVIDLASSAVSPPIAVGTGPKGVAISPDGTRVYTADYGSAVYGSSSVSIIDATTDTLLTKITNVNAPIAISIMPDGHRGYVSNTSHELSQLGGPGTLNILKTGGGIGTVTSWPEGINCGELCRADYPLNTNVILTATASDDSTFSDWGEDCYGTSNSITVTMDSIKTCTANFYSNYSEPVDDGSGDSSGNVTNYNCFIATAAYGSYLDPNVEALRKFRDEYLLTNAAGRGFVEWYYTNSPPVAEYISQHEGVRLVVRLLLTPVVYGAMYPVTAITFLIGIASLLVWKPRYIKSKSNQGQTTV